MEQDLIQPEMIAILAVKTEAERLKIAWGMWRSARRMIQRMVAVEHQNLSEEEQARIVAKRLSHGT